MLTMGLKVFININEHTKITYMYIPPEAVHFSLKKDGWAVSHLGVVVLYLSAICIPF